jgi:hypothetical protein
MGRLPAKAAARRFNTELRESGVSQSRLPAAEAPALHLTRRSQSSRRTAFLWATSPPATAFLPQRAPRAVKVCRRFRREAVTPLLSLPLRTLRLPRRSCSGAGSLR